MFDSHCHLTDIDDPAGVLQSTVASGVRSVLTCGYDADSNRAVLALAGNYPALPFSLGLHPWYADQDVDAVLELIARVRPSAVGEAGLDLWGERPVHAIDRQLAVLEAQLELARELDLPVTLHSRKAVPELFEAVRRHPGVRGVLHAFSGSIEQAQAFVARGFYVGIGGAVTRSRAKRIRRCASALPLDRIMLETDAPAIGLDTVEPPHVRPWHVRLVAEAVAALRGITVDEVEAQTDRNAEQVFGALTRADASRQA